MNSCYDNEMLRSYALFVVYVVLVKRKEMWHNNNDFFLSPPTDLVLFRIRSVQKKNLIYYRGGISVILIYFNR
jgi:hypothetical protein